MKKFAVSNVCNACGLCLIMTDLLVEDDTGHAQSAKKGYIHDEDMNRARTIVSQCPMKAISIIDSGILDQIDSVDTGNKVEKGTEESFTISKKILNGVLGTKTTTSAKENLPKKNGGVPAGIFGMFRATTSDKEDANWFDEAMSAELPNMHRTENKNDINSENQVEQDHGMSESSHQEYKIDLGTSCTLQQLPGLLEKEFNRIQVPEIKKVDVAFDANNYHIDYPYPQGEYRYIYSSEEKAIKAGLAEFNRIVYSQYRKFNLSIFVQYKLDKLKPFYSLETDGFIAKMNRKYSNLLQLFLDEADSMSNGKVRLPGDFVEFIAYPGGSLESAKDIYLYALEHYDDQSVSSGIMQEFHDRPHSDLDEYAVYFDTDDEEQDDGKSIFGNDKYSTKYCYCNLRAAVDEYAADLINAMNYVDIDEFALEKVNAAVNAYKEAAKNEFEQKLRDFRDALKNY